MPPPKKELRQLLRTLIPKDCMPEPQLDALLDYVFSSADDGDDEVVNRLSFLLDQQMPSTLHTHTTIELALLKRSNEDTHQKVNNLESKIGRIEKDNQPTPLKWQVVQGVFTAISFIASIVALLKAFGIITLL